MTRWGDHRIWSETDARTKEGYALDFLDALRPSQIYLLDFSLGGYIAQHLALHHPQLVRRLILAGTGPGKGEGTQNLNPTILDASSLPPSRSGLLQLFLRTD